MFSNGFISSLGVPDMNADGNVDSTDLFFFEEMMNDGSEEDDE